MILFTFGHMYIDVCKGCWLLHTEVILLNDIICHDMIHHYNMSDALFWLMTVKKAIVIIMLILMYKT